jgi:hypothetical protein
VQDRDPVGELLGLVEVLGREQHGGALLGEALDGLPDLEPSLGVEPGGGLVEEDDLRAPDEAHRDVEPATHAARVGRHPAGGRVGQGESVEQRVGDRARVPQVPQPRDEHEVLPPGEDLVDRRELPGEADRLAHVRGLHRDVEAVDGCRAAVGPEQRGQDPDDRGLAGTVGAEQGDDAAACHVEVHAPQDVQVLEGLHERTDVDRGVLNGRVCAHGIRSAFGPHDPSPAARSMASVNRARSLLIHWPSE